MRDYKKNPKKYFARPSIPSSKCFIANNMLFLSCLYIFRKKSKIFTQEQLKLFEFLKILKIILKIRIF